MAVKIEFEIISNAAFADGGYEEVFRVLQQLVDTFDAYNNRGTIRDISGTIRDVNGNEIGSWEATIDAEETSE